MTTIWSFRSRIRWRSAVRFVFIAAVAPIAACGTSGTTPRPQEASRVALTPDNSPASQCIGCHAEIVARYAQSGMSHSWRRVTPLLATVTQSAAGIADRVTGYRYAVVIRGSEVWQVETHADDPSHRIERRAEYAVGSGKHASAYVAADNGFLTELPVGWFGAEAGWRMNPGYELKNHRFSRPITPGCVGCHATQATHESPTVNRFPSPIADGIDCSRCHGDGAEHVTFWKSAADKAPPASAQLIDPRILTADRANDLCLQCHLQGDVTVQRWPSSPFDFRPGQRLRDLRHDFLIADQPKMLGVASHGARMLHSRCYIASGGQLSCTHCHDPHRPTADFDAAFFDAKCLACHQSQSCNRPASDRDEASANRCIACHMPQRPTREGIHLVFTDHAIRRQPAAWASAPAVLAPNSNVELTSTWPDNEPDAAELGAAYLLLHETMGPQQPALVRGHKLLAKAVANNPTDDNSRYWLGSVLLALERPEEARDELRRVLIKEPARHEARFRLALAEEGLGNPLGAIAEYQTLLMECPHWPDPQARLAQLYLAQQRAVEATAVLRQLASLEYSATTYASLALAERLAGASHEKALVTIDRAIEIDSRQPEIYVIRGALWILAGRTNEARRDFEHALHLDPGNAAARQALSTISAGR